MVGPLFSLGCVYNWKRTVTATSDWANPSSWKMKNANKPQVYWELCPKHATDYSWMLKGSIGLVGFKQNCSQEKHGSTTHVSNVWPLEFGSHFLLSQNETLRCCLHHSVWGLLLFITQQTLTGYWRRSTLLSRECLQVLRSTSWGVGMWKQTTTV